MLSDLLPVLEVVEEDVETFALDAKVLDNDAGAANDLAGVPLAIDLAETCPGTEYFGVTDLDQVDLVLGAKGLDELNVLGLGASLDEDAKVGLTLVEGLGALAETTGEAVMLERDFENLLCGCEGRVHG